MKNWVIDVGANKGDFSLDILARNPAVRVLAIEPIPKLCAEILERAKTAGVSSDIEILQCAVDTEEREANFNVADHADFGVSSLLGFAQSEIEQDAYWKARDDLYFDSTILVRVQRLDNIIAEHGIEKISFIKIDAQGLDINVLLSLGDYLAITEAGMLEVSATLDTRLYADEKYDLHKALGVLAEMGFKVYAIKPNDPAANEFNLYFCRKNLTAKFVEESLNLSGIPLYDGKHFWHGPSSQYRPTQEIDVEVLLAHMNQLEKRTQQAEAALLEGNAKLQQAEQKVQQAEQKVQQAENALNDLYQSRSWKLTKPLRLMSTLFR